MRIRTFQSEQWFPCSCADAFAFFSEAANLDAITPPWLNFRTLTAGPIVMRTGTLIDYQLHIHHIPIRWRTEIKAWEPPTRFIDEQLRGPYRLWIHEHNFEARRGGTLMRDRVRYATPFDWLVHALLVRPEIERIFAYRKEQLRGKLGSGEVAT
jgi:ligand-binding SRPBCC domain-containing protein